MKIVLSSWPAYKMYKSELLVLKEVRIGTLSLRLRVVLLVKRLSLRMVVALLRAPVIRYIAYFHSKERVTVKERIFAKGTVFRVYYL